MNQVNCLVQEENEILCFQQNPFILYLRNYVIECPHVDKRRALLRDREIFTNLLDNLTLNRCSRRAKPRNVTFLTRKYSNMYPKDDYYDL